MAITTFFSSVAASGRELTLSDIINAEQTRNTAISLLSVLALVGIWQVGAWSLPSSVLPAPTTVVQALAANLAKPDIWIDIGITLSRIAAAFLISMCVALVLGFSMALSKTAGVFFHVWIVCGITVPALVTILTLYMIIGLNDTAAVIGAAAPVIPVLAINIREGVKGIDPRLLGMAQAFRAKRRQQFASVMVPQIAPMLLASTRFGIGLIWKMVLFVELLGRGSGVGYRIEFFYQMFNMTEVLAYALSFVFVMLFIEVAILGTIERRIFRWKKQ
ncbi:ABC transporter permease [Nitratireductor aestuarii]|uniref:ABC transporter permease n=1 Tax=Nitratireductor aestuarii TaxID=1735103 RepID=A0A916RXE5_9HYPH|nr:ABC transporter permease subunit [Nitratireductor aestuarii]GGA75484.1 ABC transporter permease [Nitratireductor aestuarii]